MGKLKNEPYDEENRIKKNFVRNLKTLMKIKGIRTQAEIYRQTDINQAKFSQLYHGEFVPRTYELSQIASALNTTIDALIGDNDIRDFVFDYRNITLDNLISTIIDMENAGFIEIVETPDESTIADIMEEKVMPTSFCNYAIRLNHSLPDFMKVQKALSKWKIISESLSNEIQNETIKKPIKNGIVSEIEKKYIFQDM